MELDSTGDTRRSYHYQPFGELEAGADTDAHLTGYTGHQHDTDIGLIHMNARAYDPVLKRFLEPDPSQTIGNEPLNLNRYAYSYNNPYRYTDPTGEIPLLIPVLVFVAKEAVSYYAQESLNSVQPGLGDAMGMTSFSGMIRSVAKMGRGATKGVDPHSYSVLTAFQEIIL